MSDTLKNLVSIFSKKFGGNKPVHLLIANETNSNTLDSETSGDSNDYASNSVYMSDTNDDLMITDENWVIGDVTTENDSSSYYTSSRSILVGEGYNMETSNDRECNTSNLCTDLINGYHTEEYRTENVGGTNELNDGYGMSEEMDISYSELGQENSGVTTNMESKEFGDTSTIDYSDSNLPSLESVELQDNSMYSDN